MDVRNTSLSEKSAHRLASLIIHGRKTGINSAKALQEINEMKDTKTGKPLEIYKPLREAVISEVAKEALVVSAEDVADDLLTDLFDLNLDSGMTRLFPTRGAKTVNDLVVDFNFQCGIEKETAEYLEKWLMWSNNSENVNKWLIWRKNPENIWGFNVVYPAIQAALETVLKDYPRYRDCLPVVKVYAMDVPENIPFKESFGKKIVTKIKFMPFGINKDGSDIEYAPKGTPEYDALLVARRRIAKAFNDGIFGFKEIVVQKMSERFEAVAAGLSTIDINLIRIKSGRSSRFGYHNEEIEKHQKDRVIVLQQALGHKIINYFDNEAIGGNAWAITRRLKDNPIEGATLNVFSADLTLNEDFVLSDFPGLTHIGGEQDGVASYVDEEVIPKLEIDTGAKFDLKAIDREFESDTSPDEVRVANPDEVESSFKESTQISRNIANIVKQKIIQPVEVHTDLSLIHKKDFEANLQELALTMISCEGLPVNFIFNSKNKLYKDHAVSRLRELVPQLSDRINVPLEGSIKLIIKHVKDMGVLENDHYPVAMAGENISNGNVAIRDFNSAVKIALLQAVLVMHKSGNDFQSLVDQVSPGLERLYKACGVEINISDKEIGQLTSIDTKERIRFAVKYALPPLCRFPLKALQLIHQSNQMILEMA